MSPTFCPARPNSACPELSIPPLPSNVETGECVTQPGAPGCAATQDWSKLSRSQASFIRETQTHEHFWTSTTFVITMALVLFLLGALLLIRYIEHHNARHR